MPTFTVLCRIDAYADYVAEVEATTPRKPLSWLWRTTTTTSGSMTRRWSSTPGTTSRWMTTATQIEATRTGDFV